jgi:hypothetical protein
MMDNGTIGYNPCWLAEMNGARDRFSNLWPLPCEAYSSDFTARCIARNGC